MEPIFNDDRVMLKLNTCYKLRKVLQREGKGYQSMLYHRFGVGLSEAEFAQCVLLLVASGWVAVSTGDRGAVILTFNQAFSDVTPRSPEEVIDHAMTCPPITKELLEVK